MSTKDNFPRIGCGALIVNDKSEILLLKRSATRNQVGYWSQPGGAVDFGETLSQAIKREIKEETGLTIKLIKYLCYTEQFFPNMSQHWIAISYLAKIVRGKLENLEPSKHSEIKWFPIDKLPRKLSDTTKDSTKAYLASS